MLFVRRAVHIADIYLVVDLNGLFITYIIDVFNIELFLKLSDLAYWWICILYFPGHENLRNHYLVIIWLILIQLMEKVL